MNQTERELTICSLLIPVLERRKQEKLTIASKPDAVERNQKAVDFLIRGASGDYVTEHTLIESHPGRMQDDALFVRLLQPLEKSLENALPLPGSYHLYVEFGAVEGAKKEKAIREAIESWIRAKASTLEVSSPQTAPRHFISDIPAGAPFRVSLYRWPTSEGGFFIGRFEPKDLEKKRMERIEQALKQKCPKLQFAKSDSKATRSILVFESNDIAISNYPAIGNAFASAMIHQRNDKPDEVYLVENGIVWILKDGNVIFPEVNQPGPYFSSGSLV
ncbi:MAG: hypothetical protein COV74_04920 [Candidatus Omnitrophica bacterium CG11_big_fil_rev_8_21_14_0_20_45_26]|uniref:Uncharacterized protein n=1 Tax=Candidatus Abzuiibacterium crystallinum TaxID=1974748 RepID=A0A2H0LRV9_9BACT|nr:MAG: hypothetical protein COV74_04920 [Candidatus Omnitrophica bacterium CG11_big_fil_rev_8_21_14_0_20_45_26]PIW63603.1 MAG: hypothetical protein COW12_09835 [Candidatus Omnitrophica bacterium CG12_big_fil_rev_8_21_14_0_65_45_16]